MKLVQVSAVNFMSFGKLSASFDVETGMTLIEGRNLDDGDSNGAGKSTIWDAVSWALFGQTVRGVKTDDVIRRGAEAGGCAVLLVVESGGTTYRIRRFRKDVSMANRFLIESRFATTELGTVDATQDWLLNELKIDFELFRCTVLFAQGETFNFVNETDKRQKEILSKVKRLDFSDALGKARLAIADLAKDQAKRATDLRVLLSHVEEEPGKEARAEAAAWDEAQAAKLHSNAAELAALDPGAEFKPVDFAGPMVKVRAHITDLDRRISETSGKAETLRSHRTLLSTRISDLERLGIEGECVTCERPIDLTDVGARVANWRDQLADLEAGMTVLNRHSEKLVAERLTYAERLDALRTKQSEQAVLIQKMDGVKREILRLQKVAEQLAAAENPYLEKVAAAVAKQAKIRAKIDEITEAIASDEASLPYYQFWEKAFGDKGIKSFVFDGLCATLTARSNDYLAVLSGGSIAIAFDTQTKLKSGETREKFECAVLTDGKKVPYEAYSGGEKTRIRLAVDMALADLMSDAHGSAFNVIVFDEQDQFLDAQGRECYLRLLKQRAERQQVFVVSHDSELKSKFDTVWRVTKEKGVSRLETDPTS